METIRAVMNMKRPIGGKWKKWSKWSGAAFLTLLIGLGSQVVETAAPQGSADGQLSLGASYQDGEGVAQNFAEAMKWFRRAAEQGKQRRYCGPRFRVLRKFEIGPAKRLCMNLFAGIELEPATSRL